MATLAQIRNEVVRVIGLDDTVSGADEVLVDGWINEAVLDVLLQTRCYVTSSTTTTTAGEGDYTLDSDILQTQDMYCTDGGQTQRLRQVSPAQILDMRVASNVQQDSPTTHYAVAGSNLLMLYPIPSGTNTLTIYYVPRPSTLNEAGQDPSNTTYGGIPSEFHRALVKYAEAEAADYRDDQTSQHGDRYRTDYERWLGKIRKYVNQKGNVTTTAFEIPGRSLPPHDPSMDIR